MDKTYLKNKDGFKFVFKCSFWLGNPKLYASERKKKNWLQKPLDQWQKASNTTA